MTNKIISFFTFVIEEIFPIISIILMVKNYLTNDIIMFNGYGILTMACIAGIIYLEKYDKEDKED